MPVRDCRCVGRGKHACSQQHSEACPGPPAADHCRQDPDLRDLCSPPEGCERGLPEYVGQRSCSFCLWGVALQCLGGRAQRCLLHRDACTSQHRPLSPPAVAILLTPSITKRIGEVIVKYAEEAAADAIVIGKSDRGKLAELFLGSVSNVRGRGGLGHGQTRGDD